MNGLGRIMIVDDDREILEMTAMLLSAAGYEVTTAQSGEEAVYLLQENPSELILLDINMPGMDGWEVLRLIKEDEATRGLAVVMFSVNFELREKLHAMQQGAADYVTKPFDTGALVRRVGEILEARAAEAP